jgi:hypothetical protein
MDRTAAATATADAFVLSIGYLMTFLVSRLFSIRCCSCYCFFIIIEEVIAPDMLTHSPWAS